MHGATIKIIAEKFLSCTALANGIIFTTVKDV
jgi:hypothetical protein